MAFDDGHRSGKVIADFHRRSGFSDWGGVNCHSAHPLAVDKGHEEKTIHWVGFAESIAKVENAAQQYPILLMKVSVSHFGLFQHMSILNLIQNDILYLGYTYWHYVNSTR